VALSLTAIVIVFPFVYLILALYIKIVSPRGSVLFRQERVGMGGEHFTCLKFRTMHCGNNAPVHATHVQTLIETDVPMEKLDNYAAIIPLGNLLRKTCIDELPQLFNILRGDMSIVGPRPCMPYERDNYRPWHHERFGALPGLTGLWQVSGKNRLTFDQMMRLDIEYVRNLSPGLDMVIILKTPFAILGQVRDSMRKKPLAWRPGGAVISAMVVTGNTVPENRKVLTHR
jgi:lipopolysaccharide/colanic/teichoic acid biosynthesis glycosyltransferase